MSRPKPRPQVFRMFCACGPGSTMKEVWGRRRWRRVYTKRQCAKPQVVNCCLECQRMWPTYQYPKPGRPWTSQGETTP